MAMDKTLTRLATERMEGLASVYLKALMQAFDAAPEASVGLRGSGAYRAGSAAGEVVDLLCHRRFSHLSQTQASRYRPALLARLQADMDAARPLRFFCPCAHFQAAVEGEPAPAPAHELSAQALENSRRCGIGLGGGR